MFKLKNKTTKKEKFKSILSKLKPYIINVIIAVIIFFLSLYINDIAPFGKYDLANHDAFYQYKPMLFNFIKNIQDGTLSTYSFLNGLGNSFFFNYTYYLSSPINLFARLFKNANSMFLSIITIKLIIATITSTFYSIKKTKNNLVSTIISLSYVFSAWFLAYHQSIMWLDAFMIFPLFQYGLEKLMNEHKPYIYIFSLAYIMISNFYMAWMICLYTLVYFIYQTISTKKDIKEKLKNFNTITLSTIVVILLSLFYIYITYDSFMNIDLYINSVKADYTTLPLLNIIKAFFTGNISVSISNYGKILPNIAVNTIFTISLLYYFINNKIDKKDKVKNLLAFIFLVALIYSKTLNYIMNCFHVPIGYNHRYSFLISFFLIHLFIQNYKNFDNKIYKKVYIINALLLILLIIEYIYKNIETSIFILNLSFLIIYTLFFILYKNNKFIKYIFSIIVILEVSISTILNISPQYETIEQDLIYNTENTNYREISQDEKYLGIDNLNLYQNKNILPYFSSMQYNQVLLDLQTLGCITDNKATLTLCPNNQVFKTLLNIKTDNEYHLEKLFAVNKEIQNVSLNSEDYLENQNLLLKTIVNSNEDIIQKQELKSIKNNKNKYKITQSGTYYLKLLSIYQVIIINDNAYTYNQELVTKKDLKVTEVRNALQLELTLNKNDIIEIIYPNEKDILESLPIYYFNEKEFIKAYNKLKENQISYTSYQDNLIEGKITVNENQIIFTSIPYDDNWKVTIDGKDVNKVLVLNSLMGIECEPGTHSIKLEYKPNYTIPTLISITTFMGLITKIILDKRKQKKE